MQPIRTTLSRPARPWLRSSRSSLANPSSSVTIMPPSDQTLRFFSGCSEKAPERPKVPEFLPSMLPRMHWQESSTTGSLCLAAIAISAGMSVIWPARWTGTMALVFGVIFASTWLTSMQKLSVQSTKTGRANSSPMAPTVAMKVLAVVMTSSPGPTPSAFRPSLMASVPELTPIAWRVPIIAANFCSNSRTGLPSVKSPVGTNLRNSSRISSMFSALNCLGR